MYQNHKQRVPGNNRCLKYVVIYSCTECELIECSTKTTEVWGRHCYLQFASYERHKTHCAKIRNFLTILKVVKILITTNLICRLYRNLPSDLHYQAALNAKGK